MRDSRSDPAPPRSEFLRRSGALGVAGAAALGFPLLESRSGDAAPLRPPRDVIAAGGGATIKIGHVSGFSGVYATAAASQQLGLEIALDQAMKRNSRVKYEIYKGDDTGKPATGTTEAKRLIAQERVDLLTGTMSSGVGLAMSAAAAENNVFFLVIGASDTNMTGSKAHRVTFRVAPSIAMFANAVGPPLLQHGKKWYFLVTDYAAGHDAHARLTKILFANGGQEMGADVQPLGTTDFSPYLTKARNSGADVLIFLNYGPDTQNATKAAVQLGLHKRMFFGGLLCGNDVAAGMPVDDIVGSLWGYVWGPEAGGASTEKVYSALKSRTSNVDWRQYVGYIAGQSIANRIEQAGTTNTASLVSAFEGYRFDAGKRQPAYYRKCDHQLVQETYAAAIIEKSKRKSAGEYFAIVSSAGADFVAESCSSPDSAAADKIISSEKIALREGYTPVKI